MRRETGITASSRTEFTAGMTDADLTDDNLFEWMAVIQRFTEAAPDVLTVNNVHVAMKDAHHYRWQHHHLHVWMTWCIPTGAAMLS